MIRSLLSLGLFLALAVPAAASPPAMDGRPAPANLASASPLPSASPLFYEIRAVPGQRVRLEFEVRVDGALHLRERLAAIQPTEQGTAAVEILAYHPAERARIAKLAAEPGRKLRIRVSVNGGKQEELAFEDLVAANETLRETGFRPVATEKPEVSGPGMIPARQPAPRFLVKTEEEEELCRQACSDAYDQCYLTCYYEEYMTAGKSVPCHQCDSDYDDCVAGCSPPPPPICPTSSDHIYVEHLYDGWTGWQDCFNDIYWWGRQVLYDRYERWYRVTRYRVTRYCDGSTSTEILAVWYEFEYCYWRTPWECSDPWAPWWEPRCTMN
jgi:hypothetical protein